VADFEVDVAELRVAAEEVHGLGDSLDETDQTGATQPGEIGEVGDDEVARALVVLGKASKRSTDDLREVAAETAGRLAATADEYERREQSVVDEIARASELDAR
jgi:hypothetical protein